MLLHTIVSIIQLLSCLILVVKLRERRAEREKVKWFIWQRYDEDESAKEGLVYTTTYNTLSMDTMAYTHNITHTHCMVDSPHEDTKDWIT